MTSCQGNISRTGQDLPRAVLSSLIRHGSCPFLPQVSPSAFRRSAKRGAVPVLQPESGELDSLAGRHSRQMCERNRSFMCIRLRIASNNSSWRSSQTR